jgi:hypothetical protein
MPDCDKCGIYCKTVKYLAKHQKSAKYCEKYQNIIFVCKRCNFNTIGIKNIESHSNECTGKNIGSNPLAEIVNAKQHVENENKLLNIKINQLETKLRNKDLTIMNLQLRLQFEQMKTKIFANIIQSQTDIKVEDIIKENTEDIHIFNFNNGNIPIVVHNFVNQNDEQIVEKYTIDPPKKKIKYVKILDKTKITPNVVDDSDIIIEDDHITNTPLLKNIGPKLKKKTYRTVKDYIKTSEKELDTKLKKDVERIDKKYEEIVYNNFDVSHKEITESLEKIFESIVTSRSYTVSLSSMKFMRRKLLGKLSLVEYTKLISEHIKRLEDIFNERNFPVKKITKIVSSSLTPLDIRLVFFTGYTNVNIEIDDVQKFGLALEVLTEHEKQFVPYDKTKFFNNIKNYSLSLFELRDCVERSLINRYGFQNVIYIPKPKSTSKDPYSFYTLASVGEIRCWKMVCRLEDFTTDFIDSILPYCVSLFKKIYKDVFHDNVYRQDYMTKSQITEFDCEQLILNIITLSKPINLCKIIQDIIVSKCTIIATESDKFDFSADDKMQQKRFNSIKDSEEDMYQVIKMIFDGISKDDAMHVINSR